MARVHSGLIGLGAIIAGVSLIGGVLVTKGAAFGFNSFFGKEEEKQTSIQPGFDVKYEQEPKKQEEEKPPKEEKTLTERVNERQNERRSNRDNQGGKEKTLSEKWLDNVNSGGMYAFGKDNGYSGANGSENDCRMTAPVRVRAQMADSATTDEPGLAIGFTSVDIQGQDSNGEYCVAIPESSVVGIMVDSAGEYATNRAPAMVENIWITEDGFTIEVKQPAKHIDGIPGIVGEANHHTMSKVLAGGGSVLFTVVNNLSSALSFRTGEVTNPVEETLRKKLNRPAEIKLNGEVFEFDLMPTSTPGY